MFGNNSKLYLATEIKNGLTIPANIFFTPPFKLSNYFRLSNGGIEYLLMNASAGIMAGDNYLIELNIGDKSHLVVSSQSFEKIHKMDEDVAKRETIINIGQQSYLKYTPLPTIPFAGSNFSNVTVINLVDATSKLIYLEILSCGRYLCGERFQYKSYKSLISIYQMNKLVFRDNSVFEPTLMNMECFGMFEGYTHFANLIIFGLEILESVISRINELFLAYNVDGGITELLNGGYLVRAFAKETEALIKCFQAVISIVEYDNNLSY